MSNLYEYLYQRLAAEIRCFETGRCCGRSKILPNNLPFYKFLCGIEDDIRTEVQVLDSQENEN